MPWHHRLRQGGQEGAQAVLAKAAGRTQNGGGIVRRAFNMNVLAGIMRGRHWPRWCRRRRKVRRLSRRCRCPGLGPGKASSRRRRAGKGGKRINWVKKTASQPQPSRRRLKKSGGSASSSRQAACPVHWRSCSGETMTRSNRLVFSSSAETSGWSSWAPAIKVSVEETVVMGRTATRLSWRSSVLLLR